MHGARADGFTKTGYKIWREGIGGGPRPAAVCRRVRDLSGPQTTEARTGLMVEMIIAAQAEEEVIEHVEICAQARRRASLHKGKYSLRAGHLRVKNHQMRRTSEKRLSFRRQCLPGR